jgi:hypothetical protein
MQRIYLPELNISEENITVTDKEIVHQLTKVLRTRI